MRVEVRGLHSSLLNLNLNLNLSFWCSRTRFAGRHPIFRGFAAEPSVGL